jgi:cell division septation protein DedD
VSEAKQQFGLPTGVWMLVGGLSALMLGYTLGSVLTTTTVFDFLLPHASVPVNVAPDNERPLRATQMGSSAETPTTAEPPAGQPGSIVLQVAALKLEDHARALANELKQKGFPAFVNEANVDKFYRVQVGPYTDRPSAQQTALALKRQGLEVLLRSQ